jgi:hypothetical protein
LFAERKTSLEQASFNLSESLPEIRQSLDKRKEEIIDISSGLDRDSSRQEQHSSGNQDNQAGSSHSDGAPLRSYLQELEKWISADAEPNEINDPELEAWEKVLQGEPDLKDTAMLEFLNNKGKLREKITSDVMQRINIGSLDSKLTNIYKHLRANFNIIRSYSQYSNYTLEKAIAAYNNIKEAYASEMYHKRAKEICQEMGFPFAQM